MKTIIVDDELWAVNQLEKELKNNENIELVGSFRDPFAALKFAEEHRVGDNVILRTHRGKLLAQGKEIYRHHISLFPLFLLDELG